MATPTETTLPTHETVDAFVDEERTDRQPHATESLRDTVADHVILGTGTGELAELCGYSPSGMRQLMKSEDVQERVATRRTRLLEAGSRSFFRFLMHADRLAADQLADALNPSDENHYRARTWILERIMPKRETSTGDHNVTVAINHEVMVQLGEALKATSTSLSSAHTGSPVLLEGKLAMPRIDK